jgi:hypothetical protein
MRKFSILSLLISSAIFVAALLAFPAAALADGIGNIGAFASDVLGGEFGTAGVVWVLSTVAIACIGLSKLWPGKATMLNVAAAVATGAAGAIELLGPKATLVAMLVAGVGAAIGYFRSETRAASKPAVAAERIAALRAG